MLTKVIKVNLEAVNNRFPNHQGVENNAPANGAILDLTSPQYRLGSYMILSKSTLFPPFNSRNERTSEHGYRLARKKNTLSENSLHNTRIGKLTGVKEFLGSAHAILRGLIA